MKRVEKWVEQKIKNRQKHCLPAVLSGGPEGSRTPVRRSDDQSISERSLCFNIPSEGLPQTGFPLQ